MTEQQWPPDYRAEWNRRARLKNDCLNDATLIPKLHIHYRNHPIDFIEDWCITFDPRRKGPRLMPFVLFERQKQFVQFLIECWRDGAGGLVEKSRDMGATWGAAAVSVWMWLFHAYISIGWGSRKTDLVDRKGEPDSIFEKIRMIILNIPSYMLPIDFKPALHMPYMRILNLQNGSTISGEGGDDIGRGGRKSIYFKDESAHYERPEKIEASLSENTDVQIDMSSVNGTANPFYRRRMAGQIWYPGKEIAAGITRVFVMDWRDHPSKTQEWHDQKEKRWMREGMIHIFRQEVDRDYSGSIPGVIIPAPWVEASIDAHKVLGIEPIGEKVAGQDVADGGSDRNALVLRHGVICKFADHWGGEAQDAAKIALPHCISWNIDELDYDCIGVGTGFKAEMNTQSEFPGFPQHLKISPWNAGWAVLDPTDNVIPGDEKSPTNENTYKNLKAQGYFRLRTRFYKTFRAVKHGDVYPHDELVSIDSTIECLADLKAQLSQPVSKKDNSGLVIVDKMPDGAISPNLADAFNICYNPVREYSIYDAL